MDWITERVAIGNRIEAHDAALRQREGFRAVVCLDGSLNDELALAIGYDDCIVHNMIDGPGNDSAKFRRIVDGLIAFDSDCAPVLVHCHAGRSRSVTVVVAYLMLTRGMTSNQAIAYVSQRRDIQIQPGLRGLLLRL